MILFKIIIATAIFLSFAISGPINDLGMISKHRTSHHLVCANQYSVFSILPKARNKTSIKKFSCHHQLRANCFLDSKMLLNYILFEVCLIEGESKKYIPLHSLGPNVYVANPLSVFRRTTQMPVNVNAMLGLPYKYPQD